MQRHGAYCIDSHCVPLCISTLRFLLHRKTACLTRALFLVKVTQLKIAHSQGFSTFLSRISRNLFQRNYRLSQLTIHQLSVNLTLPNSKAKALGTRLSESVTLDIDLHGRDSDNHVKTQLFIIIN